MRYEPTAQRSGGSGVSISIGIIEMKFDLVPTGRTKKVEDSATRMVCPEKHATPVRVEQRYICPDDEKHGPYLPADVARAREMPDGTLVKVDAEKVATAKAGGKETGRLELSVYPADQVDNEVLPSGKTYRLRPSKGTRSKVSDRDVEMYAVWRELISKRSDVVLMGRLLLRGTPSLYRLGVWGGQLVLEELAHPDDLADRDVIEVDVAESTVGKLAQFVDGHLEDWDPGVLSFDVAAAIDQVAAEATGDAPADAPAATASAGLDLDALLDRALAATAA